MKTGIRGIIHHILSIYIGYKLIIFSFGNPWSISSSDLLIFGLILIGTSLWFLLERFGILP